MLRPVLAAVGVAAALAAIPVRAADDAVARRNAELAKSLTGAVLVGQFTVTGGAPEAPATERYELAKVAPLGGDSWSIQARMRYGDRDVPLPPLVLPIKWAGDTPVITVDSLGLPGVGSYTARVMIYRDHYAGFWTGKDHGGHLFGVIERGDAAKKTNHDDATDTTQEK